MIGAGMKELGVLALLIAAGACGKASDPPLPPASNRTAAEVTPAADGRFEGVIGGHQFSIVIDGGKVTSSDRSMWTWRVGPGRLVLQDTGPITEDTRYLVARSPRTIVRGNEGMWLVTEVVTTAGGHMFTCLHQQVIDEDGSAGAKLASARGTAACTSLHVAP